ncbi:MAG: DUF58 domain-containing protein [Salibacteraceae bacterium]|nr:DUF58 domain-containing protein [Salibacteraceae bacterium]|tara:strand:+ start:18598 stop:19476 length:879 start_codon:yes stop_codon:yes gene_type:complete
MDTSDLLKKVRKIEIKTRGLSNQLFAGEYHSAFKGSGMTFNEVRDYHPGDEIRKIDWNVTARFNSPFVKVFEEEREMTVMLLVDTSASEFFGTRVQLKKELITEICAVLSFSAIQNNDKIGVIFFGNEVEKFIPPKKGKSHILRIIRELISFEPKTQGTNIGEALRYLTNAIKKKSTAFLLSDFLDDKNYESALKVANKKHDLIGLRIYDRLQEDLPNIGLVPFYDAESGSTILVDTSSKSVRTDYNLNSRKQREGLFDQFKKAGIDYANISTQDNYVRPLMNLFKKRERRR